MAFSKIHWDLGDKSGRRLGSDRRRFCYSCHIPERRSGADRRANKDRISGPGIIPEPQSFGVPDEHKEKIDLRAILN